ncbi:hypothetical protein JCM19046_4741 [Bacillus sp. JCM 19046]|nr:hypothetical protein JCM19046_4741 [Bacillus sp. JCM 19046]
MFELEDSPYLLLSMRLKEIHVNSSVEMLKSRSTPLLFAILEVFNWIIMTLEGLGHSAKLVVEGATNIHLYGNPKNLIRSIFTDYDERVKQKVREATGF